MPYEELTEIKNNVSSYTSIILYNLYDKHSCLKYFNNFMSWHRLKCNLNVGFNNVVFI